jgi:hypothetical protein
MKTRNPSGRQPGEKKGNKNDKQRSMWWQAKKTGGGKAGEDKTTGNRS